MDHVENQCNEANAYGCKVTHKLIRPDMYICGDEVGGNLSMKGDGNEAWKLLLGERRYIAQEKASAQNRKFTSICFTALTGDPVMCVLIFEGKTPNGSIMRLASTLLSSQMDIHQIQTLLRSIQDLGSISLELLCVNLRKKFQLSLDSTRVHQTRRKS